MEIRWRLNSKMITRLFFFQKDFKRDLQSVEFKIENWTGYSQFLISKFLKHFSRKFFIKRIAKTLTRVHMYWTEDWDWYVSRDGYRRRMRLRWDDKLKFFVVSSFHRVPNRSTGVCHKTFQHSTLNFFHVKLNMQNVSMQPVEKKVVNLSQSDLYVYGVFNVELEDLQSKSLAAYPKFKCWKNNMWYIVCWSFNTALNFNMNLISR